MSAHLNLFRFYNESPAVEFIENNLSRAFCLCLANDPIFFHEYIRNVTTEIDYHYLFSTLSKDTKYEIDLQVNTANIERENFKTVYAVAMTSDKNLNIDDLFEQAECTDKINITDIFISIKDIAIIIEVKRTGENCKQQLFNQVLPFINEPEKFKVNAVKFSWHEVVKLMEKAKHVQQLLGQKPVFINDFLALSETRYPEWFEPKPFNLILFYAHEQTVNYPPLQKRMRQALSGIAPVNSDDYQLLPYNDRLGIGIPFGWASELIVQFETDPDDIKEYVIFYIWPGNTKQQGTFLYSKPLGWTKKSSLLVEGVEYELEIAYNIKLCHFNRFISGITFYENDLQKLLHTSDNFGQYSGKWHSEDWDEFEKLMDEHFQEEFRWREKCDWQNNFINTERNYFTMSLGFEVAVYIPYSKFKTMDRKEDDVNSVSSFISKLAAAYKELI
jgi:hypothetical protein